MADIITGNTELAASKMDFIAEMALRELEFAVKLKPFTTDYSGFASKGVKSIELPNLESFTVGDRASATKGDATTLSVSNDVIDLNLRKYVSWLVDTNDEVQSRLDVQAEYAKRAASAHGRDCDSQIVSVLDGAASENINGAAPADITRDSILAMREHLLSNEAQREDIVLMLPVSMETAMLKIEEFTRADAYGSSNIPAGQIGQVFGIPCVVTNSFAGQQAYMYSKEAVGIAFQRNVQIDSQKEIEFGVGAERWMMDVLYGISHLYDNKKGAAVGQSPLIAKLAD